MYAGKAGVCATHGASAGAAARAVIAVSKNGRGFVVDGRFPNPAKQKFALQGFSTSPFLKRRYIITAAHCLPRFPPPHRATYAKKKMYRKLLGPLGAAPSIWGECLFADPVSDLAVLGRPSGQDFGETVVEAWDDFIEEVEPLDLNPDDQPTRGWMLSLKRQWMPCTIHTTRYGHLIVKGTAGSIVAGMSGSPILSDNRRVVGVVSITGHWPQAHLPNTLPQWLAQQLTATSQRSSM